MLYTHLSKNIEAIQFKNNLDEIIDFCDDSFFLDETGGYIKGFDNTDIVINYGDYIVKDPDGNFSVVREDLFEREYKRIDL